MAFAYFNAPFMLGYQAQHVIPQAAGLRTVGFAPADNEAANAIPDLVHATGKSRPPAAP